MIAPFDPVQATTPLVIVIIFAEMVAARVRQRHAFEPRDTIASLSMGVGNVASGAAMFVIPISLAGMIAHYRLFRPDEFTLINVAVCFVVNDFRAYWGHRMGHRVRWAWADHVSHHSSQHFNYSTGLRLGWTYYFTPAFLTIIPMLIVGFPLAMIVFVHGLNLVYQFLMHTEHLRRLPRPIEFLMNTPSHHRVHHGSNPRYLDRNYGCVFIIWDRMFGTYADECDADPPRFGLVQNIGTFNPLRLATHEWLSILCDVRRAGSVREAVMHILGPPGWAPNGGATSNEIRRRWQSTGHCADDSWEGGDNETAMQLQPSVANSLPSAPQKWSSPLTMPPIADGDNAPSNNQSVQAAVSWDQAVRSSVGP